MSTIRPIHRKARLVGAAGAAVLALGSAIASGGADAAPTPAAPAASDHVSAQQHPARVITHRGVGELRLGDSAREIRAAGGRVPGAPKGACRALVLPDRKAQPNRTDGFVAPGQGLVAVFARPGMRTSEGVHLGSRLGAVKRAYPRLHRAQPGYRAVKVGPGIHYELGFDDGRVVELALVDDDQPCFG